MRYYSSMTTVVHGDFEWDSEKGWSNLRKHGVSFEEAASAIVDERGVLFGDTLDPTRLVVVGMSYRNRVLLVVHCERQERVRIISARRATHHERKAYEET